jgi:hypothetical protein
MPQPQEFLIAKEHLSPGMDFPVPVWFCLFRFKFPRLLIWPKASEFPTNGAIIRRNRLGGLLND